MLFGVQSLYKWRWSLAGPGVHWSLLMSTICGDHFFNSMSQFWRHPVGRNFDCCDLLGRKVTLTYATWWKKGSEVNVFKFHFPVCIPSLVRCGDVKMCALWSLQMRLDEGWEMHAGLGIFACDCRMLFFQGCICRVSSLRLRCMAVAHHKSSWQSTGLVWLICKVPDRMIIDASIGLNVCRQVCALCRYRSNMILI